MEPDKVIQVYADAGYDVLAFTDHRKANPVSAYNSRGMTLISGMELHPDGPRGIMWHILGLGLPEDFIYPDPASGQEAVDAVNRGQIGRPVPRQEFESSAPEKLAFDTVPEPMELVQGLTRISVMGRGIDPDRAADLAGNSAEIFFRQVQFRVFLFDQS